MEQFLLNLLKTSLLGALAILLMLVSKPLWRERYRAKARCWLWLALAAFLLFPVDFSVKDAPVQAAPPQDYTLFVGTDKTTMAYSLAPVFLDFMGFLASALKCCPSI